MGEVILSLYLNYEYIGSNNHSKPIGKTKRMLEVNIIKSEF